MASANKRIYTFENGDGKNKQLLGGKGAGLVNMTSIGLPVPPGFVITTEVCRAFNAAGKVLPSGLMAEVAEHIHYIEGKAGKIFGDAANPLLVSVRSGAAMSMPGMMDTVLNLGLNDSTVEGLAALTSNPRFAYDAYRRFVQLFGKIALEVPDEHYDEAMAKKKASRSVKLDTELDATAMKELAQEFKAITQKFTGKPFPTDPMEQLEIAIKAVFGSWMGARAVAYRREFKITPEQADGTAVNVVSMVFGNMGGDSATGVCFTRDPGTGENVFYGEYLTNAQGEDVVAGIRTPKPIAEMQVDLPASYAQLMDIRQKLEANFHEVQDLEFTIEKNKLYMLQTRNGKMNAQATVRSSIEMFEQGLITKEQAIMRVKPEMIDQLLHKCIDPKFKGKALAKGLNASPGAATGACVFDADDAVKEAKTGKKVILVREETKPEDIHGFFVAQGILTSRGGKTSHAAVVARGMGKSCVSGAEDIRVDVHLKQAVVGETILREGDIITIDGTSGNIFQGEVPLIDPEVTGNFGKFLSLCDSVRRLGVRANADTPDGARKAREFGAEGIGLVRTERMFNAVDRLPIVVDMIMADTVEERKVHLDRLLPLQKKDFIDIFTVMSPFPVTVRFLDPPLHEFLPSLEVVMREIYELRLKGEPETSPVIIHKTRVMKKVKELMEVNPMIGHRGIRLGVTHPEIYEMQARAILDATAECIKAGKEVHVELMLPNLTDVNELIWMRENVMNRVVAELEAKHNMKIPFMYGTMVECVRAALTAAKVAEVAEFFSFGTNDLSQGTFSYSREDVENKFMPKYVDLKILPANPFEILDRPGVGRVMKIAVDEGRSTRKTLKCGICGEHGGEPSSIEWCHIIGLTYVSCSAFRIPVARLAAAQAAIMNP
ncbi:pyruvate, phosphate dikinase [Pelomyxa schiedti]|nr:pyruvate, phosphate dikinase [Pelomyxa schiedti]